ncbi:MAG TPA: SigE family RNA polymerase sigma factor [Jatrophihabitans sp.]|jgi:RNA polymerase sigma-70 factor (sigma-E family)|nr:SigE family RNA polymerase sigma factor [Jatrophihabitans sp.]
MAEVSEFSVFVRSHSTALLRSAYLLTGDRASAEDLVQDTFLRLFPRWSRVVAADVPLAYVRRSMMNNFLNSRRRAGHEVLLAELPERGYDPDLAGPLSDRELVRGLLADLPPKQRAVLVLRFYDDLSDAQIAAELGCRQGTVRSIVSRSLGVLRAETERRPRPRDTSPTNGNLR